MNPYIQRFENSNYSIINFEDTSSRDPEIELV